MKATHAAIHARVEFIKIAPYIQNMIHTYTHPQKKMVEKASLQGLRFGKLICNI